MNRLFRATVVEISGVRTIAGGGTNASDAGQALLNLSGVSITGDQTINGVKSFANNVNITGDLILSGGYNVKTQIENTKNLAIAYAIAL